MQGDLQREAERARYALRSSFFYRAHIFWSNLVRLAGSATSLRLGWGARRQLGISHTAWKRVREKRIPPIFVFCHPEAIKQKPPLIAYYRCLALLPQKGLQRLAVATKKLEEGTSTSVSRPRASKIAHVLNSLISLLIESDPNWTLEGAQIAALLNLGAQVNGSWRNEIGTEGSRRVKELLVGSFAETGIVRHIIKQDASQVVPAQEIPPLVEIRGFVTTNDHTVVFGSEPDVSILDPKDILLASIEVKYGLDPAGALERYGAAKKSFEQAVRENTRVTNVYLASCITAEVRRRINEDRLVNQDFNLTEILGDAEKRQQFLAYIRRLLNL